MLSVQVILVESDCHVGTKEKTIHAISLAGVNSVASCLQADVEKTILESKSDLIHVLMAGTIILPDFYRAMTTTIEHEKSDFVTCRCGVLQEPPRIVKAGETAFDSAQVLVRRWVYQEMGVGDVSPVDLIGKVLGEYRGTEVPHILVMR